MKIYGNACNIKKAGVYFCQCYHRRLPDDGLMCCTYPIHSLNSRAFGTVALRRMMLT